jgi:putative hydrolase of the HAD superfamily
LQPLAPPRSSPQYAPVAPALGAVLFDMGGTLDGDGVHWLDRFAAAYLAAGVALPFDRLRAAFDEAERRAATDQQMASADLRTMLQRHVSWQFEHLALTDERLADEIVDRFEQPIRAIAARNGALLNALIARGLLLGVVSNGCGNVDALCRDLGYADALSVVIDSRRAGVAKPDLRIYRIAADALALPPALVMMVGDSFDRDIVPAKVIGMQTAWLHGGRVCPDAARVDLLLESLADLPAALDRRGRAAS